MEKDSWGSRISFAGELSEEADFTPLLKEEFKQRLLVDFSEVSRVNSCGLRAWMEFVFQLNGRGVRLVLERCSPAIVSQLNMISNFGGVGAEVRSVLAPYYCEACDIENCFLLDFSLSQEVEMTMKCAQCGGTMEFSEIPSYYFSFRDRLRGRQ